MSLTYTLGSLLTNRINYDKDIGFYERREGARGMERQEKQQQQTNNYKKEGGEYESMRRSTIGSVAGVI